jgi:hypothetical protein
MTPPTGHRRERVKKRMAARILSGQAAFPAAPLRVPLLKHGGARRRKPRLTPIISASVFIPSSQASVASPDRGSLKSATHIPFPPNIPHPTHPDSTRRRATTEARQAPFQSPRSPQNEKPERTHGVFCKPWGHRSLARQSSSTVTARKDGARSMSHQGSLTSSAPR